MRLRYDDDFMQDGCHLCCSLIPHKYHALKSIQQRIKSVTKALAYEQNGGPDFFQSAVARLFACPQQRREGGGSSLTMQISRQATPDDVDGRPNQPKWETETHRKERRVDSIGNKSQRATLCGQLSHRRNSLGRNIVRPLWPILGRHPSSLSLSPEVKVQPNYQINKQSSRQCGFDPPLPSKVQSAWHLLKVGQSNADGNENWSVKKPTPPVFPI